MCVRKDVVSFLKLYVGFLSINVNKGATKKKPLCDAEQTKRQKTNRSATVKQTGFSMYPV